MLKILGIVGLALEGETFTQDVVNNPERLQRADQGAGRRDMTNVSFAQFYISLMIYD